MKQEFVDLSRMSRLAVDIGKNHAPGKRRRRSITAAGDETAEAADRDRRRHRDGETIAGGCANIERPFGHDYAEISADESEQDRFATAEPCRSAQQTGPVGNHKWQLRSDHCADKRPQTHAEFFGRPIRRGAVESHAPDGTANDCQGDDKGIRERHGKYCLLRGFNTKRSLAPTSGVLAIARVRRDTERCKRRKGNDVTTGQHVMNATFHQPAKIEVVCIQK